MKIFSNRLTKYNSIVKKINNLEDTYCNMTDEELKNQTSIFKNLIYQGKTLDSILPNAFAVVREASKRVLGLRHYDVQLLGGIVLHNGCIAEMKTGEGKTLVAVCPAYLNALTGNSVHIVTVNEYLAKRDMENMGRVFNFLGLTTSVILSSQSIEEKKYAYNCDIIYGTNSEFGFDYLRNNMAVSNYDKSQGKLSFAIIDEADSILIDESRTPLIITQAYDKSSDLYINADTFAKTLDKENDLVISEKDKSVTLSDSGISKAENYFGLENYMDIENLELAHHISQAIYANSLMKNNVDYIIQDDKVIIIDGFTGRLMPDKRFSQGLHQAIEAKENVSIKNESKVCATITYQNFFRMYDKLSGMTGTAKTEEEEFKSIYKVPVIQIPTNKPIMRIDKTDVVYKTKKAKFNAIVDEIKSRHSNGQPILIGTTSIETSEYLSDLLNQENISHQILNAKHHEKESFIIAQAGRLNTVTVATNMAGRGTDIILGGNPELLSKKELLNDGYTKEDLFLLDINVESLVDESDIERFNLIKSKYEQLLDKYKESCSCEQKQVLDAGGLYIIGTERHESRRIDDQLRGRSGRQGDIGESKFFISLEDDLIRIFGGDTLYNICDKLGLEDDLPLDTNLLSKSIQSAQKKVEGTHFAARKHLLKYDNVMNSQRELIYKQRDEILSAQSFASIFNRISNSFICSIFEDFNLVSSSLKSLNISEFIKSFNSYISPYSISVDDVNNLKSRQDLHSYLINFLNNIYLSLESSISDKNIDISIIKDAILFSIDSFWQNHIDDMTELRQGIGLRSLAQQDPVVIYGVEGSNLFYSMNKNIQANIIHNICELSIDIKNIES